MELNFEFFGQKKHEHAQLANKGKTPLIAAPLHIAMASPEIAPFAKTGGLGDVLGSLPKALERLGARVSLVMPAYRYVLRGDFQLEDTGISFVVPISDRREEGTILKTRIERDITVYFVRADRYYDREHFYGTHGHDYIDNAERFIFFARSALEVLKLEPPSILHAHDWQSALAIVFLKAQPHIYPELSSVKTVFTVHNLGYQGLFWNLDWHLLNIDWKFFTPEYLEFYDRVNFLKGGLVFADAVTTVSPTYAEEIKTPKRGFGLDGVLRERSDSLVGILNGADYNVWNPETDNFIKKRYSINNLLGKKECKTEIQHYFGLPEEPNKPLIGMVSRLIEQKGFDLLEEGMDRLLSRDLQFILLGTGDKRFEEFLRKLPDRYPDKTGVQIAFHEALSHRIVAGCDMFLMPSHYEPSGLTQIYSLKYGTIPIVRATGGLKDTVREFEPHSGKGNGFLFANYEVEELLDAVDRALAIFHHKDKWMALIRNAMACDYSWERSAREYLELYRRLVAR